MKHPGIFSKCLFFVSIVAISLMLAPLLSKAVFARSVEMRGEFRGYATVQSLDCETVSSWVAQQFSGLVELAACQDNGRHPIVLMLGKQSHVSAKIAVRFRSPEALEQYQEALVIIPSLRLRYPSVSGADELFYATHQIFVDDRRVVRMGTLANRSPKQLARFTVSTNHFELYSEREGRMSASIGAIGTALTVQEVDRLKSYLSLRKIEYERGRINIYHFDWLERPMSVRHVELSNLEFFGRDIVPSAFHQSLVSVYMEVPWTKFAIGR